MARPYFSQTEYSFQSTSLSRGKTRRVRWFYSCLYLSIHFPLTREDPCTDPERRRLYPFQSTSLSRGKTFHSNYNGSDSHFQSTSLSRGKTRGRRKNYRLQQSFNPLPSHEGRPYTPGTCRVKPRLSIHFPLTREDNQKVIIFSGFILSIHFPLTREDGRLRVNLPCK